MRPPQSWMFPQKGWEEIVSPIFKKKSFFLDLLFNTVWLQGSALLAGLPRGHFLLFPGDSRAPSCGCSSHSPSSSSRKPFLPITFLLFPPCPPPRPFRVASPPTVRWEKQTLACGLPSLVWKLLFLFPKQRGQRKLRCRLHAQPSSTSFAFITFVLFPFPTKYKILKYYFLGSERIFLFQWPSLQPFQKFKSLSCLNIP